MTDQLESIEGRILKRIADLADQVYAEAALLDKKPRYMISDLSTLIKWVTYETQNPGDPEAIAAIAAFREALGTPTPAPRISPPLTVGGRQIVFLLFLGLMSIAAALFTLAGFHLTAFVGIGCLVFMAARGFFKS